MVKFVGCLIENGVKIWEKVEGETSKICKDQIFLLIKI